MAYILEPFDRNLGECLAYGYQVEDRTGVGCLMLPGVTTRIDISRRMPVPTGRQTNWKAMLKEYLWFLSGSHNINDLTASGSKVWEFWRDDNFTSSNDLPDGSIGHGYGFNLRNYGGDIRDIASNPGFDQMEFVMGELKNNPTSRRILFSFYRPDKAGAKDCVLPPCHMVYQFIVTPDEHGVMNGLHCCVYQRSSDAFVGNLSTNLQGAAFLTYMIGQQVGMLPKTLTHTSGNFHIYNNHIEQVKEYLQRDKPSSPILKLNRRRSIYDYTADDFKLSDYRPKASMKIKVAV